MLSLETNTKVGMGGHLLHSTVGRNDGAHRFGAQFRSHCCRPSSRALRTINMLCCLTVGDVALRLLSMSDFRFPISSRSGLHAHEGRYVWNQICGRVLMTMLPCCPSIYVPSRPNVVKTHQLQDFIQFDV